MLNVRSGESQPRLGWGEVIHASATGLTNGTTTLLAGGSYTTWIRSFVLDIATAAASETVTLKTSAGVTIFSTGADYAHVVSHNYEEGWPVHRVAGSGNTPSIDLVISGGGPSVSVAVEVIRKLANNTVVT